MAILSTIKWMVSVFYNYKMDNDIKANCLIIKSTDLDSISGLMGVYIMEIIQKEKETDRVK